MKRYGIGLVAAVLLLVGQPAAADEGMWPIYQLQRIQRQMRAAGLKLKPEAIYHAEMPALADAVVAVDGGMGSGSMISDEGLMITNHHVAYSDICALSTPERNLLTQGFWARTRAEELPVAGKSVWFLRRTADVTAEVEQMIDSVKSTGRWGVMAMRKIYGELERRHSEASGMEASCASMWNGRQYVMFYYDIYRDVRLVGAPPASIGSFGGNYDNWGWPQHKGDFALYRVYGTAEGRPAEYSAENVPLKPRSVLDISTVGVREGDFTMVVGFPGRTNRYASSEAVREKQEVRNPVIITGRHERMNIIERHMERDSLTRLAYADAFFGLSNYADYAKWENRCLQRFDVISVRRAEEAAMQQWIEADADRKTKYGTLLDDMARGYAARREAERILNWYREAWLGPSEALLTANRVASFIAKLDRQHKEIFDIESRDAQPVLRGVIHLEKNYDVATDRDILARMMVLFTESVPRSMWGEGLEAMYDAAGGDAERMAHEAFDASFCASAERYAAFFAENRPVAEIHSDPLVRLAESVPVRRFTAIVGEAEKQVNLDVSALERTYAQVLYDYRAAAGIAQYPNANSTMRLTYGQVCDLDPADGIRYASYSTVRGYLEKYDPTVYDFMVNDRLQQLLKAGDWGRWGERGELHVNFLTNNDITGGNSGSPVLDARGRLVGLAFDGNRESMSGDIWFNPEMTRTVCVDIRYVLWVIEHYAEATWLLEEMHLVK